MKKWIWIPILIIIILLLGCQKQDKEEEAGVAERLAGNFSNRLSTFPQACKERGEIVHSAKENTPKYDPAPCREISVYQGQNGTDNWGNTRNRGKMVGKRYRRFCLHVVPAVM